jgi:hypothetical protein
MIKDIIVHLEYRITRDPARDFAISVADAFDAHVAGGVAFAYTPYFPGYGMLQIPADIVAQMIAESEKSAWAAIERFDAAARRSLVSAEHRLIKAVGAAAPAILSALARRFYLSVFMQSEPNGVKNDDMIETSLFQSGRPLIVVPYIQKDGLKLDRVVCLWDGSRAAARAFDDTLPLLAKGAKADLLIVLNEKTKGNNNVILGFEIATHLVRHDVKVEIETMPAADIDVASAILSDVADSSGVHVALSGASNLSRRES